MKKILSALFVLAMLVANAQIPSNGLITYYPMGETYSSGNPPVTHKDLSGNGYDLTCVNSYGYGTGRTNQTNEAAMFNFAYGSDMRAYDYTNDLTAFEQTGDFTVSAWVRPDTGMVVGYQSIIQVGQNSIFLRFFRSGSTYYIQGGKRTNSTAYPTITATVTIADYYNNWNLITLKKEGGTTTLYSNNTQIGQNASAGTSMLYVAGDKKFKVGNSSEPSTVFKGKIQDVFYYNRALTPNEIAQLACNVPGVTILAAPSQDNCPGAGVILSATPVNNPINWFTSPFGGASVHAGATYNLAAVNNTITYYAEANNGGCISFPRTPIELRTTPVNTTPASKLTVCTGTTTTLTATGNNLTWFNVPTGGSSLGSGNSFITPPITANTTFYVQDNCGTGRVAISVQVTSAQFSAPTAASSSVSVCKGNATLLSATGDNTIYWFTTPTGGTPIDSGINFTTPVINAATTFYAQNGLGVCASNRTSIDVNLAVAPTGIITFSNDTIRATNVYDSYVLRRDGIVVASSGNTGSFKYHVTDCGNYQATFTNTTNNCSATLGVSFSNFTYNNPNSCEGRLSLSGAAAVFPVLFGVDLPGFPITPTTVDTQNPVNWNLSGNTTCTALSGVQRYAVIQTPNGCQYTTNTFTVGNINTAQTLTSFSDTVTACEFTSNIITVSNINQGTPTNTTAANALNICSGASTTLTATGTGTLYWFDVPTGGTDLGSGNSFNTGTLTANKTFYVQSGNGVCASPRVSIAVTVNAAPTAAIIPATVTICEGTSATLTASGGGTYTWSNSGGSNAAATFSPTTTTTYTVTVTQNGCSATASRQVTVNANPTAAITPANPAICNGASQTLTASGGTQYAWSSSLGTGASKSVSPTTTTTYTVTVTNAANCTSTASATVTVNTVTAAINGPTTICSGLQATLTASGGTSYAWSNSGGSSASATFTPTQTTTYTVTVTGAGNCTATASQTVSVQSAPTATIAGSTEVCAGSSTTLTANGGNTYTWANGLGGNAAITVSPTQTTTYTVTVSIGVNCTASSSQTVTVKQPSAKTLTEAICQGKTFTFKGQQLAQGGVYRDTLLNAVGCDSIITLNLTVTPVLQGSFSDVICFGDSYTFNNQTLTQNGAYKDTVQTAGGCDSIITLNLTVLNKIENTITAAICTGQSYTFKGQQLTQAGQYFDTLQTTLGCDSFIVLNLSVNSFVTSSISQSICQGQSFSFNGQQLTQAGSYNDTLTSVGGCDSILTLTLTVNALSQPTIIQNGNVLSTQTFNNYQWQLNANNINGATAQSYTAAQNGNYTVVVTDANGCSNISAAVNVTGVGIVDLVEVDVKVYPNPTNGQLQIVTSAMIKNIVIYNLQGQIVWSANHHTTELDLTDFAEGAYFMIINMREGIARRTIVKQ